MFEHYNEKHPWGESNPSMVSFMIVLGILFFLWMFLAAYFGWDVGPMDDSPGA